MSNELGKMIVIEGPDGSGKTTISNALAERLRSSGHEAVQVRDPGGTPVGEEIRAFFKQNANFLSIDDQIALLLFSKRSLVNNVIKPALARGAFVVCDRFMDSLFAYQWGGFSNFDSNVKANIDDRLLAYGLDLHPDVKIVLDGEIASLDQRMASREEQDVLDKSDFDFKERVRRYYRNHLVESTHGSTFYVNTVEGEFNTIEQVFKLCRETLFS